ncbi:TPA: site-specific DNA-methyltransferase [Vibrio parahaemolyticus]|nr:site-specific DNA-methyltransferase [Vibrio parahaemolyticus]HCG6955080.1 site-specific DNA-methyltransferase [Vibrio parahaemolyticus]
MSEMEKITGSSPEAKSLDITNQNIEQLKELFPDVFSEGKIDFEALRALLGEEVDDSEERYNFTWNGKTKARQIAQTPSTGTLRPCKDESVNWDTTENLFIEGDNLEVLKLLQKSYHKKVKMIYIDPPYNTGRDFVYKDNFHDNLKNYLEVSGQLDSEGNRISTNSDTSGRYHSDWLSMMYPRLKLARNLLKDDGLIFISIDDNEQSNLRSLCDEIFGEDNFIDPIIWKKRYGGGAKEKYLVALHEYTLVYCKNKALLDNLYIPLTQEGIDRYYKSEDEHVKTRGPYRTHPLEAMKSFDIRENLNFPIPAPDGTEVWPKRQWRWGQERVEQALAINEIEFSKKSDGWVLSSKQYLRDEEGNIRKTKPFSIIDDVYTQHGTNEIVKLFGDAKVFDFPKPSEFIKKLITIGLNYEKDEIILDFFAGSATTAHSVMKLNAEDGGNRKFILVQIPQELEDNKIKSKFGFKTISDISKARIIKSANLINETETKDFDSGFKVLKLDTTNIRPWDAEFDNLEQMLQQAEKSIKADRSSEDVLYEIFLKYGYDLTTPVETEVVNGKNVFVVGAGALFVCLDDEITTDTVEGIAKLKEKYDPETTQVVFKDEGFADDRVKTNAIQILKQAAIDDVKSI